MNNQNYQINDIKMSLNKYKELDKELKEIKTKNTIKTIGIGIMIAIIAWWYIIIFMAGYEATQRTKFCGGPTDALGNTM